MASARLPASRSTSDATRAMARTEDDDQNAGGDSTVVRGRAGWLPDGMGWVYGPGPICGAPMGAVESRVVACFVSHIISTSPKILFAEQQCRCISPLKVLFFSGYFEYYIVCTEYFQL